MNSSDLAPAILHRAHLGIRSSSFRDLIQSSRPQAVKDEEEEQVEEGEAICMLAACGGTPRNSRSRRRDMYVRMYIYIYVYMYKYVYIYIYIYIYV